jgi:excisionase family DNA binding protein
MAKGISEVLTTKEACEYLRISRPTYLKLIYTNQIKAKKVGKGWKALRSELRAYLEQLETPRKGIAELGRLEGNGKRKIPALRKRGVVDAIDQDIIRTLSLYDHLRPLQLWYELREDLVVKGRISMEEMRKRLECLVARGFVERVRQPSFASGSDPEVYRLKRRKTVAGNEEERLRELAL